MFPGQAWNMWKHSCVHSYCFVFVALVPCHVLALLTMFANLKTPDIGCRILRNLSASANMWLNHVGKLSDWSRRSVNRLRRSWQPCIPYIYKPESAYVRCVSLALTRSCICYDQNVYLKYQGRIYLHGSPYYLLTELSLSWGAAKLCSYSRTSQHFMEPEGSIPCSHEPPTVPILSHINPIHTIPSYLGGPY
jgi:hypothetical protein